MLLQTNSYIVPKDKRSEHLRLLQRFRQTLARLGCEHFETYEQVGANWAGSETTGRFVQLMRFRDRRQQQHVQAAERSDPMAQALIREFCELINFPYQQQQGLFAVGFYQGTSATTGPLRQPPGMLGMNPVVAREGTMIDSADQDLLAGEVVHEQFGVEFVGSELLNSDLNGGEVNGQNSLSELSGSDPLDPSRAPISADEDDGADSGQPLRIRSEDISSAEVESASDNAEERVAPARRELAGGEMGGETAGEIET